MKSASMTSYRCGYFWEFATARGAVRLVASGTAVLRWCFWISSPAMLLWGSFLLPLSVSLSCIAIHICMKQMRRLVLSLCQQVVGKAGVGYSSAQCCRY